PNALSSRGHSAATSTAMAATKSAIQTTLTRPILSTGAQPFVSVSHPKRGVYKPCFGVQARHVQAWMGLPYLVLWGTLMTVLFVKAKWLPSCCARCGRRPSEGDHCFCEYGRQ